MSIKKLGYFLVLREVRDAVQLQTPSTSLEYRNNIMAHTLLVTMWIKNMSISLLYFCVKWQAVLYKLALQAVVLPKLCIAITTVANYVNINMVGKSRFVIANFIFCFVLTSKSTSHLKIDLQEALHFCCLILFASINLF